MNLVEIAKIIFETLKGELKEGNNLTEAFAKTEANKIVETLRMLEKLKLSGEIDEEEAKLLFRQQLESTRATLLSIEGFNILLVEKAINLALHRVRDQVNGAFAFRLL